MLVYQDTPGRAAELRERWPQASRIQRADDQATLVIVAHPKCPCTRATIGELNSLMAQCHGKVNAYVLFFKPRGTAEAWEKTDLWYSAAAIPGVRVLTDLGGLESHRFHASTSGQALLFSNSGRLLFSGGITAGRGHAGDNAGCDAIVSLVMTGRAERNKTPVFGCSIIDIV
jgi:hypothetical protein